MSIKQITTKYNLNPLYLKKVIKMKNVTQQELMQLFDRSIASIYTRLSGSKMFTIKEAFLLADYLDMDINKLFAPTQDDVMNVIVRDKL